MLMICLSSQWLVRFSIIAWYQVNKDYISKNLCENRDKPKMKCCGKCYLKKKLSKVDNKETTGKHLPSSTDKTEIIDCVIPQAISVQRIFCSEEHSVYAIAATFYKHLHANLVFHPPSTVCWSGTTVARIAILYSCKLFWMKFMKFEVLIMIGAGTYIWACEVPGCAAGIRESGVLHLSYYHAAQMQNRFWTPSVAASTVAACCSWLPAINACAGCAIGRV